MDLKCKSCGFPLVVKPGEVVAKCEACGLVNTLPSMDTDQKILRCNRANDYRQICEFDQAAQLFEDILKEDAREPEAYWGLVLCKYGVQYVDDPKDGHRVPTCNRIQSTPITADVDYQKALTYADASRLGVYRYQAREIDEIQKKIIEISSHEKPYDVFICYKELDNLTGQRTQDSVLAQELYRELTDYHLRVFFARITLREKLGVEYEPYIYAALTSAPVMIHVTTSYNNSNAPWVKNEWSRYLSLKNSGSDKSFTVAYKGLNPDIALPKEFSGKQASDLSRVGAMQEIAEWASQAVKRYKEKQGRGHEDEEALKITLTRAFQYLAAGNRNQAEEMFRACVASDKTCAEAYLGLVMTRRNYMNRRQLGTGMVSLTDDLNFNLAVQYADEDLRRELKAAEAQIQNRIREKREADARKAEEERLEAERKAEAERQRKEQERLEKERADREAKEEEKRKRREEELRRKEIQREKAIGTIGVVVLVGCIIIYLSFIRPAIEKFNQYKEATVLLQNDNYAEAYSSFVKLARSDYRNSSELISTVYQECLSDAESWMQDGYYLKAYCALTSMEEYAEDYNAAEFYKLKYQACVGLNYYDSAYDCLGYFLSDANEIENSVQELKAQSLQNLSVGSVVVMGAFEQDGNTDNGAEPVMWKVLDMQDGRAFLISDKILAYREYSDGYSYNYTWEDSPIRDWLNTTFYTDVFSEDEKARIIETKYESEREYKDGSRESAYTSEKITLLSDKEFEIYFKDEGSGNAEATKAASNDFHWDSSEKNCWFLRSPYDYRVPYDFFPAEGRIAIIDNGQIREDLSYQHWDDTGTRPAMWIKIPD